MQGQASPPLFETWEFLILAGAKTPTSRGKKESKTLNDELPSPRAENAKIDVKVIGASQEMCNYLPLLQKLPAALVIRKVKVTKHSSRVSLREIFT